MSEFYVIDEKNLNIIPEYAVDTNVYVKQYDGDYTRLIKFHIYNGSEEYTIPTGSTIEVRGSSKDNQGFNYVCTYSKNIVTVPLTRKMTMSCGVVRCELAIKLPSVGDSATANYNLVVEKATVLAKDIASSSEFQTLNEYVNSAHYYNLLSQSYATGNTGIRDSEAIDNSEYYKRLSQSWAVGGTGLRNDESVNNAKYYSEVLHNYISSEPAVMEEIDNEIDRWLDDHPEATTTVADGTITMAKLSTDVKDTMAIKDARPFRYLLVSDTHLSYQPWYGVSAADRMKKLIKDLNYEISTSKVDGIIHLGDLGLDYWSSGGSLNYDTSNTKNFIDTYLPKLKSNIFIGPGNHDAYSEEDWVSMTGMKRQFTIADKNNNVAFIFLDTFKPTDPTVYDSDQTYTNVDTEYLQEELDKCSGMYVFLCAHYFKPADESTDFKRIVRENDNILALFAGHTHKASAIDLGSDYGNKKIYQTGNYSYSGEADPLSCMWGFRELALTENGIVTNYITPSYENIVINGNYYSGEYSLSYSDVISQEIVAVENTPEYTFDDNKKFVDDSFIGYVGENSDLNSYTKFGKYICPSGTIAATLLNAPYEIYSGFMLIVDRLTSYDGANGVNKWTAQFIIPNSREFGIVSRSYNLSNETWGDWTDLSSTFVSGLQDSDYYRKRLVDCLPLSKISNVSSSTEIEDRTFEFPFASSKGGVWRIYACAAAGGKIVGCKELIVFEPYLSTGTINVFEEKAYGTSSAVVYTVNELTNTIVFSTSSYSLKIYRQKIKVL